MKLSLNSASTILCCTLPGCVLHDFSPRAKHHFHICIIKWDRTLESVSPLWLCMQWVTHCQAAIGCGYSASLKPRSVRLEGRLLSSLHSLCGLFLYWVHISPVQLAWSVAPRPDFEASVVNTMSRESWATGQLLDPHQRRCLLSAKLCDCNPLMKSAELLSAFLHHLTSGINVAKCSKNPGKLSVCTMWSSLKNQCL